MTDISNKSAYRRMQETRAAQQRRRGNVMFVLGGAESIIAKGRDNNPFKPLKNDVAETYLDGLNAHRQARALETKGKTIGGFIAHAQRLSAQQQASFAEASQHYEAMRSAPGNIGDTFERTRHDARSGKEIHETVRKRGVARPAAVSRPSGRER